MSLSWKITTVLVLALMGISLFAQDVKADHPNYLLFRIGDQSYDQDGPFFGMPTDAVITDVERPEYVLQLTEGIHFNKWAALEGSVLWEGKSDVNLVQGDTTSRITSEVYGFNLAGLLTYNITPWLFVYGKAGANYWRMENRLEQGDNVSHLSDDGVALLLGGGVQALFSHTYSVALAWEQSETNDSEFSRVTLGVGFIF